MSQLIHAREIHDIHGGIHPPERKELSNQTPIEDAGIPDELVLPLSQHIGAPAEVLVEPGQKVLKGEQIAKAAGFVSVPLHAPTSGEVIAIENRVVPHASGMENLCIVIKPDMQDSWCELDPVADYTTLDKKDILNRIREAGIAGMGGAGFPSAVKLSTGDANIEQLIINGTECEPYITADDVLMRERADKIIGGVKILQHIIQPQETIIGVEDNKPEGIEALRKAAEGTDIQVASFPTKYPSGGEKQLIQILTGKEVPSGGLPSHVGVVCQNLGSTEAIYNAIVEGKPLISRVTTLTGEAISKPGNYQTLIGTPYRYLLDKVGYDANKASRLVMGGPMMGFAMPSDEVPVVKTTNCILVPTKEELPPPAPAQACIRCGMCAEACPVTLLPQQMYWFAQSREYDKLQEHNLNDCIECGCCSYVCPSQIPLVQYYRAAKAEIREQQLEAQAAEKSKARFEARQARLEKEEAEKEAKRKARQEAAKARAAAAAAKPDEPVDEKQAVIQAALQRTEAKKQQKVELSDDPVQAAIQRAQAKRAGAETDEDPVEAAKRQLASIEKRLKGAEEKLAAAEAEGSDKIDAFRTGVEKTKEKLAQAQQALADAEAQAANKPAEKQAEPAETTNSADPVQAIIERAKAKQAGTLEESPVDEARHKVTALEKRIGKTTEKLEAAKAEENEQLVEVLSGSLEKMQAQLADAKQQLESLEA